MKLIVHVTKNNLSVDEAVELYAEIRECLAEKFTSPPGPEGNKLLLHINGQVVDKFTGYSPEHPNGHEVNP